MQQLDNFSEGNCIWPAHCLPAGARRAARTVGSHERSATATWARLRGCGCCDSRSEGGSGRAQAGAASCFPPGCTPGCCSGAAIHDPSTDIVIIAQHLDLTAVWHVYARKGACDPVCVCMLSGVVVQVCLLLHQLQSVARNGGCMQVVTVQP